VKVLFVYTLYSSLAPEAPLETQDEISFGISYISAYLKRHGHETRLFVATQSSSFATFDSEIRDFNPDAVAFTCVASEYGRVRKFAEHCKKEHRNILRVMGGAHPSLSPTEDMLEFFDAICVGEGEIPMLAIANGLQQGQLKLWEIPSIWYRKGGVVLKNKTCDFIEDLDALPVPDREMWQRWISNTESRLSILLGRGCPYICTYCSNHALKEIAEGTYVRMRSAGNIIQEVSEMRAQYSWAREIYMEVETFGGGKIDAALDFCRRLQDYNESSGNQVRFGINFRAARYLERFSVLFPAMYSAGFRYINIGLESGSERIRRGILRRNETNEDLLKTVTLIKANRMQVTLYNLIGLPHETEEDILETIRMNRLLHPDNHYLSIFYPYPGTKLHAMCVELGAVSDKGVIEVECERVDPLHGLPDITAEKVLWYFLWFNFLVAYPGSSGYSLIRDLVGRYKWVYGIKGKSLATAVRDCAYDVMQFAFRKRDFRVFLLFVGMLFNESVKRTFAFLPRLGWR
jgi:radical SAM superfamily enzyme YgiQ (UPF0313 family)